MMQNQKNDFLKIKMAEIEQKYLQTQRQSFWIEAMPIKKQQVELVQQCKYTDAILNRHNIQLNEGNNISAMNFPQNQEENITQEENNNWLWLKPRNEPDNNFRDPNFVIAKYMEAVRQEFEMNGRTVDDVDVQPMKPECSQKEHSVKPCPMIAEENSREILERLQMQLITKQLVQQRQAYLNNTYFRSLLLTQTNVAAVATAAAVQNLSTSINELTTNQNLKAFPFNRISSNNHNPSTSGSAYVKSCVFCLNNCEPEEFTKSHSIRDPNGRVLCPKLRNYKCPICKATGDNAHTIKYCPKKASITMNDLNARIKPLSATKNLNIYTAAKWSDEIDY